MLRSLYNWTMRLAGHRHAIWALAGVSFIESSVFPLPPDLLLIPMVLADRRKAFLYAAVCTLASVAGGFLGYAIGHFLWESLGQKIIQTYGLMDAYIRFKTNFDQYGAEYIIIKGLLPVPYKIITIASGAFNFDLATFAVASLISRALRFFLVAGLFWKFGEPIRTFVEKWLTLVTTAFAVLLVGGFVLVKYLH
ncbi:YqaA family protein [Nitrospirillum sp. BR 11163]|uniref:YqaA family protein n=1 Tax=Nitrospirillum sp. BR 11163 TaxID=3104323 RepID=UPI002AFE3E7C|nr:VTT domain-containing protein [Nitrospirillum sp. BR 11163]MEA1675460.1 VTT domain-containing protein [Nitrospirillum sp. BR 11163]